MTQTKLPPGKPGRFNVHVDASLKMLDDVIQDAMGWLDELMPWKRP